MAKQKTRIPDIGDIVYLRTDPEQYLRLITSFVVEPSGMLLYKLALGDRKSDHYEFEMIKDVENRKAVTGFAQKQNERSNKQRRSPRPAKGNTEPV